MTAQPLLFAQDNFFVKEKSGAGGGAAV